MEKIKVNDTYEYEIREIAQDENSCAIILCTENTNEVVERFKTVEKLDVYNEDGMLRESLTDYHTYSGVSYLPEYPAVKVVLKEASLEDKVAALDKKVNGTVNESSMSLEQFKEYKITQLGLACRDVIYAGLDVETSKGKEHFTFNDDDQKNIKTLFDAALMTKMDVPYHQSKDSCTIYPWTDAVTIYITLQSMLLYNITYCNALNMYIREDLTSKEDVQKVVYGQEVPVDRKETMDIALAKGQALMDAILIACGMKEDPNAEVGEVTE